MAFAALFFAPFAFAPFFFAAMARAYRAHHGREHPRGLTRENIEPQGVPRLRGSGCQRSAAVAAAGSLRGLGSVILTDACRYMLVEHPPEPQDAPDPALRCIRARFVLSTPRAWGRCDLCTLHHRCGTLRGPVAITARLARMERLAERKSR